MKTTYTPQAMLNKEAIEALIEKMGVSNAMEFWSSIGMGKGDYTKNRKNLFRNYSVKNIAEEIKKNRH